MACGVLRWTATRTLRTRDAKRWGGYAATAWDNMAFCAAVRRRISLMSCRRRGGKRGQCVGLHERLATEGVVGTAAAAIAFVTLR
jgi:hypothetical protein